MKILPTSMSCRADSSLLLLSLKSQHALKDERLLPRVVFIGPENDYSGGQLDGPCLDFLTKTGGITLPRPHGWENGAGPPASRMRIRTFTQLVEVGEQKGLVDDDFIFILDSDTILWRKHFFDALAQQTGAQLGNRADDYCFQTAFGPMQHCSGGFNFVRWQTAKKLAALSDGQIEEIMAEMYRLGISMNEDVVFSLAIVYTGGTIERLQGSHFDFSSEGFFKNPEGCCTSFVHIAAYAGAYMGTTLSHKRNLAALLDEMDKNPWKHITPES